MAEQLGLEILLKLYDQASGDLDKYRAKLKGFQEEQNKQNKENEKQSKGMLKSFRDTIMPASQLFRTIARVGFIFGATFGAAAKLISDTGKEIKELDDLAIRLGVSTEELSQKIHGFNIATQEIRVGTEAAKGFWKILVDIKDSIGAGISGSIGEMAIQARMLKNLTKGGSYTLAGRDVALKQLEEEAKIRNANSKEILAIQADLENKTKQLALSTTEYKSFQLDEQTARLRAAGVAETAIQDYIKEYQIRTAQDEEIQIEQLAAQRLMAEGNVTMALDREFNVQLMAFKRVWGADSAVTKAFIATQKVIMDKKIWDVWQTAIKAVASALGELESALAGASEMDRKFAKAAAAVALALAIINTATGITRAFKDYSWPWSMVVAGIIAAAGAVQIATIAATKFHSGGLIRAHDGLAIDEIPIIAQRGEGVLSRRGMSALGGETALNRLNQGQGGTNSIYVNIERVDFRDEQQAEDFYARLSRILEQKRRSKI